MKVAVKLAKYLVISCAALLFLVSLMGLSVSKRQEQKDQQRLPAELPAIISKVRSLKIVRIERKGEDLSTAIIEITIRNKTDKPVIAVAVEATDGKDSVGTNVNGFKEGDEPPSVVIEPLGVITVSFPLSNLQHCRPGTPIKVGGVLFEDGSEEGDLDSLGTIRRQREHYKAMKSVKNREN